MNSVVCHFDMSIGTASFRIAAVYVDPSDVQASAKNYPIGNVSTGFIPVSRHPMSDDVLQEPRFFVVFYGDRIRVCSC